jgi:hypothetical protein
MFNFRLRRRNIIDAVQADQDYMGLCLCRISIINIYWDDIFRTEISENTESYFVESKFDECQPISLFHRITINHS